VQDLRYPDPRPVLSDGPHGCLLAEVGHICLRVSLSQPADLLNVLLQY
jgi:hypothetical protein